MINESSAKAALYLAIQFSVGGAVIRWILLPRTAGVSPAAFAAWERAISGVAFAASILALASVSVRLFAHANAAFGGEAFRWENLRIIAIESRWGAAWRKQMLAAFAMCVTAAALRVGKGAIWMIYAVATLAMAATVPLLGHGAGTNERFFLHFLHILAVSVWLGSLFAIAVLYLRKFDIAPLLHRFSMVALPSAAVVVATGVILASIYVGSLSNLFATDYGKALLFKIAGFVGILAFGWRNWRRAQADRTAHFGWIAAELAFALLVIVITSVLTEMEHP